MSGQIFISYRREESRWSARSLYDRLSAHFDRKQIFMDIDAIAPGADFFEAIEKRVGECDVLIAVIGTHWLTSKDEHDGRRLDNPDDLLRMEIATALKRAIRVIPVLVDGALMPRSIDLPDDLKSLVRRNSLRIGDISFDDDCRRLTAAIEEVLEKNAAEQRDREEKERLDTEGKRREEQEQRDAKQLEKLRLEAERQERLMQEAEVRQRAEAEREEVERLQREKERLEGARLEQKRLEAEEHEKKRLELLQREKERQEAEQQETERLQTERLEAEASKLKQEERLKADQQIRDRSEAELRERLEARRRVREERERREHESQSQTANVPYRESQCQSTLDKQARFRIHAFSEPERLLVVAKFSFVPFLLDLLSLFFPFQEIDWPISGFSGFSSYVQNNFSDHSYNVLAGAFLCLFLVLISSFLKYKWKRFLEAIVSYIGVIILADAFFHAWFPGFGFKVACTFAAAGAIIKTWLLIHRRKLEI
jgi:hypothetical protein